MENKSLNDVIEEIKKQYSANEFDEMIEDQYFLILKKHWERIKEERSKKIEKFVDVYERQTCNISFIYVAEDEENICKIGFCKGYPDKRIRALSTKYHREFKLRGYLQCTQPRDFEKAIHKDLKDYRLKGEWFALSYEKIKKLTKLNFFDV